MIRIDLLDEHRTNIDLDTKTLTFPYLHLQPAMNEEIKWKATQEEEEYTECKLPLNITQEEIKDKIKESEGIKEQEKARIGEILRSHRRVFRRESGIL